jgi:hypothetical protein
MPVTIIHTYRLSKELWQQFYEAHYSCDRDLKIRYLWGAICILIGALGFGGYYDSKIVAGLLLATGFFGVLSKYLLIYKSLLAAKKHPFFGKELTVSVSPEELSVRSENSGYSQPWDNFIGYRKMAPGFLLYHDRHSFFFIPTAELTAGDCNRIIRILADSEVPEIKAFK